MLIAADGANSPLRRRFLPAVAARYAGYVAWRGTLDERIAPSRLVSFLDNAFTFCEARSGGAYARLLHPRRRGRYRAWASSDQLGLVYRGGRVGACPLSDRQGRRHHASLVQGSASGALIGEICDLADREVHPIFAELVATTADPFVQTIVDVIVPQTVFGRVMLLGDAAFVVRPHTAGATAKADDNAAGVLASVEFAAHHEAGFGGGRRDQFDDDSVADERLGAPVLANEGEEPVFDFASLPTRIGRHHQTSGSAGGLKSSRVGIGSLSFWINVFDQRTEVS